MLPLSDLLTGDVSWIYDHPQEEAFKKVKAMLTETPELAFNDARKHFVISADASNYGVGAAIFEQFGDKVKPIAFVSRTLTAGEIR